MTTALRQFADFYGKAIARWEVHRGELLSVQRLRGIAVLMVLVVHAEDIARKLPALASFHSLYSARIGYSAPDLFFVISGFIMTYVTVGSEFRPRRWLLGRFFRIVPLYVFFTFLAMLLWLHNPNMTMGSGAHDWGSVIRSLLMLPQAGLPLLFVGWTVEHELVFYAVVFMVARYLGMAALPWVMAALSLGAVAKWALRTYAGIELWDFHLFSLYVVQFAMGVMVYQLWSRERFNGVAAPLLLGCLLMALGGLFAHSGEINREQLVRVLAFGGAFACFLHGLLNLERRLRAKGHAPQRRDFLVQVGDASYSIYLTHPFVLASCGKLFQVVNVSPAISVVLALSAGLSTLLVGFATHILIEKPIIEMGKRLTRKFG